MSESVVSSSLPHPEVEVTVARMPALPLRVGVIGFEGVNAIDLAGPLEVFANARDMDADGEPARDRPLRYEIVVIGVSKKAFTAESGVGFEAHVTLANAGR